jgi:hypothetical protein
MSPTLPHPIRLFPANPVNHVQNSLRDAFPFFFNLFGAPPSPPPPVTGFHGKQMPVKASQTKSNHFFPDPMNFANHVQKR